MSNKILTLGISGFKVVGNSREFSCYGNTKGNIDHAQDRTLNGAYTDSIVAHKEAGTMPKMFWMHNPFEPPIGTWLDMKEDEKGLYMEGRFANTPRGLEVYELMKEGALDSFSIGYKTVEERWNSERGCNDLLKLDIVEVSVVTFACNEESRLVDIKSRLAEGKLISKADLRLLLEQNPVSLSKRQIEKITADYNPKHEQDLAGLKGLLESSSLFG